MHDYEIVMNLQQKQVDYVNNEGVIKEVVLVQEKGIICLYELVKIDVQVKEGINVEKRV